MANSPQSRGTFVWEVRVWYGLDYQPVKPAETRRANIFSNPAKAFEFIKHVINDHNSDLDKGDSNNPHWSMNQRTTIPKKSEKLNLEYFMYNGTRGPEVTAIWMNRIEVDKTFWSAPNSGSDSE